MLKEKLCREETFVTGCIQNVSHLVSKQNSCRNAHRNACRNSCRYANVCRNVSFSGNFVHLPNDDPPQDYWVLWE